MRQNTPHTIKVGTVISNSWGYDQTNVDLYQVVKTTQYFVYLRPISGVLEQTGFMSGEVTPIVDQFCSKMVTRHKVNVYGENNENQSVRFEFGSGRIWNPGETLYESWYA